MTKDIFEFIKEQEVQYAQPFEVMENWNWNMKEHIHTSMMLKHGNFKEATNDIKYKQPNKNIIYPNLNLRYRAEDIDMKDVVLYVDDPEAYHLSFLIKKYHDEVYVSKAKLDDFFDEAKEEKIDLGGALVRKGKNGPALETLESIAFCDQTDILSGPIGFKMFFSPSELYDMESVGWGNPKNGADVTLDDLITLAEDAKQQDSQKGLKTQTPGKYVEVYRVHGSFPKEWLTDKEEASEGKERYVRQMHVVGFYKNKDGIDTGVTLYRKREYESPFKLHLSGKKIRNRALAYGGVEELFAPQIWTNYSEIRKKELLDAVSKIVRWTDDESLASRNKLSELENNEMLVVQKGSQVGVLNMNAPNVQLFNEWIQEWNSTGQLTSGATDALLGKNPASGSPFALQNLVTQNGMGLHDYRRGKFATFIAEIYNDWIIQDIAREIASGVTFLATLSSEEMEYVADCLAVSAWNKYAVKKILDGGTFEEGEKDQWIQTYTDDVKKKGTKHFLKILKDEFKTKTIRVKVNVAGKQKDLAGVVDKMTNVFRQVISNPAVLQDPKAVKVFNKLIEYSGMDPIDFGYTNAKPQPQLSPMQPVQGQMPQQMPQLPANVPQ